MSAVLAGLTRRIVTMPATMVAVPVTDTAAMKRLTEFASDVLELADVRPVRELRDLIARRRSSR